ncbi:MAG: insulinase family protein, partial [Gammaproteobacteria bacterium]|nr:insulinase family protein [Gammaproteobacteria bacterium]
MKKQITCICLALLLTACGRSGDVSEADTTAGSPKIFDMPYLMRDLDNGLRVIVVPTDYPDIVTIQIPVQTGSRNEVEAGKTGFAHFFEHMMFRGTERYPADVYSGILKKAGADQNAYTTNDYTNYHITFTKDDLEKIIELEADRFRNLSYSEADFRTEALAVKGEYLKNFSNPTSKMLERIRDLMFSKHTYKHTTMGFIEDIEAMPDQLEYSKTFFDRWYRPEKTVVILVGDVEPEASFELVKKYWGGWERGDYSIDVPVEPPLGGPKYEHMRWDSPTQAWLTMTYRGPAYRPTEKDMPALDLLSSIYFSESSQL